MVLSERRDQWASLIWDYSLAQWFAKTKTNKQKTHPQNTHNNNKPKIDITVIYGYEQVELKIWKIKSDER